MGPGRIPCLRALTISRELADRRTEAKTLKCLGLVYAALGRVEEVREVEAQSISISLELDDTPFDR